ncbi:MAG: YCF48-related protein [Xenococcaceae cyanobacterium MO_188.B32]|nr:YCF48-related protein [Xenococcaceae cyanobacterium MO_188.B32]
MKQANLTIGNWGQIFKALSLFFLLTFTVLIFDVPAAWAHTPHDDIFQVDISPTYDQDKTLFIIVRGNLLKSEDGGTSWQRIVKGLDNKHRLYSLDIYVQSKDTIFLSSLGDGIYKSQDEGSSWSKVNSGLENLNIDLLAISFHNPDLVLAAGEDRKLYRTEDGGMNWYPVLENQQKITAIAYVADRENLLFVGDEQGNIYFSNDRGNVWQSILTIHREGAIKAIAVSPYFTKDQTLFIGTEKGSIFRSIDGGKSFAQIDDSNSHPGITSLVLAPQTPGNWSLFAVTEYDGVFYSDNSGRSWQDYSRGLTGDPQAYKLKRPYFSELQISPAFPQDRTVFLAGYNGLFKSTNGGQKWQEIDTLSAKTIVGLDLSPDYANDSTIAVGTYIWGSYLSSDRGVGWQAANKGLEEFQRIKKQTGISRIFEIVFSPNYASDRTIFATTGHGLFKSTDRKQWGSPHWQQIQPKDKRWWSTASQGVTIVVSPNFAEDSTIYLGTMDGHILRSTDGGKNFSFVSTLERAVNSLTISPNFTTDQTLYAGLPNQVYKSVDGGFNWQVASNGIVWLEGLDETKEVPVRLAISPNYEVDRTVFVGTAGGVFVTTDRGESWQQLVNTGYGDDGYIEGIALSPDFSSDRAKPGSEADRTLMVSVRGRGLFKSVDAGSNFSEVGNDLIDNNHLLSNMYGFPLVSASRPIQFSPAYSEDRTIYGYSETKLFKSEDGGNTWSAITIPIPDGNLLTFVYLGIKTFPLLTFVVALTTALLSYLMLGYLRLDKKLPWRKIPIRTGGTFAVFMIVLLVLSS